MNIDWSLAREDRDRLPDEHGAKLLALVEDLARAPDKYRHRVEARNGRGGLLEYRHPDPPYSITYQYRSGRLRVVRVDLPDIRWMPRRLFISYAHEDKAWLEMFEQYLRPGARNRDIEVTWDGLIEPGETWEDVLEAQLNTSSMALLLVSIHLLNSDYVTNTELPILIERKQTDRVPILWTLVSDCPWQELELLERTQALGNPDVPLDNLKGFRRRKAVTESCQGILRMMAR